MLKSICGKIKKYLLGFIVRAYLTQFWLINACQKQKNILTALNKTSISSFIERIRDSGRNIQTGGQARRQTDKSFLNSQQAI
jgi:hypothetical protein